MQYKQCAVIEFLVAEKESLRNFHKCLCNIYRSAAAVDRSTVGRRVQKVTATELHDLLRSGCPIVAVRPDVLQRDDAIVREDGRIKTRQLALILSISKGSASRIVRDL
jgi:hypothetical protein